jgi:hypothetical protein
LRSPSYISAEYVHCTGWYKNADAPLHIWGIPGSKFSMETSCLETSYLDGCQCQRIPSNEVVTTFLILYNLLIHNVRRDHGNFLSVDAMI